MFEPEQLATCSIWSAQAVLFGSEPQKCPGRNSQSCSSLSCNRVMFDATALAVLFESELQTSRTADESNVLHTHAQSLT